MASHQYDWELQPDRRVVIRLDEVQIQEIEEENTRSRGLEALAELCLALRDRGMVPKEVELQTEAGTRLLTLPALLIDALHPCPDWLVTELADEGYVLTLTRCWLYRVDPNRTPSPDEIRRWIQ